MKWKIIFLTLLVLASAVVISLVRSGRTEEKKPIVDDAPEKTTLSNWENNLGKVPERNWKVLDPDLSAEAAIVQSLDDNFPFFKSGSFKMWPLASLTKLLTAAVVMEKIDLDEKIIISQDVALTEGEAGDLRPGETYAARDLLKIMLIASSNRAAAAFEYHVGHDEFVKMMTTKAREIGLTQTTVYDASGLNDLNQGTASDMLALLNYILEKEPDILNYTRLPSLLVQPANSDRSHTVPNIDPLSDRPDFLGGKTGTSPLARQNLVAILSMNGRRVAVVLLGSKDRFKETDELFNWIARAYEF
ncbi:MAG: serine hydrolase [Patescibacteria group bacterium]